MRPDAAEPTTPATRAAGAGAGEGAVRFIDLSGSTQAVRAALTRVPEVARRGTRGAPRAARQRLVVHEVGDYVASYVPSIGDFDRLDPRFRLSPDIWRALPEYADWGFAVFALRVPTAAGGGREPKAEFHPMGLSFPRRDPDRLFFPTVHVHDGVVHEKAHFHHTLFFQLREQESDEFGGWEAPRVEGWTRSIRYARDFVEVDEMGVVAGDRHVYGRRISGVQPNHDIHVDDR